MKSVMPKFILTCFHARTNAHLLHLASKSYAQHIALEEFYTGLTELTDQIAEVWQGDYGQIAFGDYPVTGSVKFVDDPSALMDGLSAWIADHRNETCDKDDTYIQNLIDEIVALTRRTQYKLTNLK